MHWSPLWIARGPPVGRLPERPEQLWGVIRAVGITTGAFHSPANVNLHLVHQRPDTGLPIEGACGALRTLAIQCHHGEVGRRPAAMPDLGTLYRGFEHFHGMVTMVKHSYLVWPTSLGWVPRSNWSNFHETRWFLIPNLPPGDFTQVRQKWNSDSVLKLQPPWDGYHGQI